MLKNKLRTGGSTILSALLCMVECTCGIAVSYMTDISASAIIILLAAILYLLAALRRKLRPAS